MSERETLIVLWNIAAKFTFRLVGIAWTDIKQIDQTSPNIYSEMSEKKNHNKWPP